MTTALGRYETVAELRRLLAERRGAGDTIGFVPTMGALHAGHAKLIERARRESGFVAVSIFVNPLQFDRADDLAKYPRTLDADMAMCQSLGADAVFTPTVAEMYPAQQACTIHVERLADHLCGRYRPGHFDGMATVVMKLLQIAQPDMAYFGEKDAQQLAIVRRLVADFNMPVAIVGVPTVREPDGLALSSRNTRLTPSERRKAIALPEALRAAEAAIRAGVTDASEVIRVATLKIPVDEALRLEYLEVVGPDDVQPVTTIEGPVLIAGALWVGATRLIDNIRASR
jgi:pantoate--beta-alanine ligase